MMNSVGNNLLAGAAACVFLFVGGCATPPCSTHNQEVYDNGNFKFPVHFTVITDRPGAADTATLRQLRIELELLNQFFVAENGEKLVRFEWAGASLYSNISGSSCDLVNMVDMGVEHHFSDWDNAVNNCTDPQVIDPNAINYIIYDNYAGIRGYEDVTSRGRINGFKPFVMIDIARLNHSTGSPGEHEMGHAFGLGHVCVPDATRGTGTNIMSSAGDYTDASGNLVTCGGEGGLRNIGFDSSQVATILTNAALIQAELASTP